MSELNSLTDKWIYFLKEAACLDPIPDNLGEISERKMALNIANKINMTAEELDLVDRRGIALQDERGQITYGVEQGRLKEANSLIMRQLTAVSELVR